MFYHNLMELIEKNEELLIHELNTEIRSMEETLHYRDLPEDILHEMLHQVLYNVYKRLSSWLHNNTSKNVVFAYYTGLGRVRSKEGIPLGEVIQVLFLIKKKIYRYITEKRSLDDGYALNQTTELFSYVNLFFDKIVHATIVGYQEEQATRIGS